MKTLFKSLRVYCYFFIMMFAGATGLGLFNEGVAGLAMAATIYAGYYIEKNYFKTKDKKCDCE